MLQRLRTEMETLADPRVAAQSQRFFKTGPGQYGEGDHFIGIRVPGLRRLAREYGALGMEAVERLLQSKTHEHRQVALFILVNQFKRGSETSRQRIYMLYQRNLGHINNWDLVDASAPHIVGAWLENRSRSPLKRLARADALWERRMAILATFHYIRKGEFEETLRLAQMLLKDREDLIHKAVGWMLREVGKRAPETAEVFLRRRYRAMPRTMLRYAIEKFPEAKRQAYLKGEL
ncbi:MAG: DNA alkylation repair protein [Desulfobacterales bacterium]|nr:DNA alkylation repair protein [Desulfobacterales bacterium]